MDTPQCADHYHYYLIRVIDYICAYGRAENGDDGQRITITRVAAMMLKN